MKEGEWRFSSRARVLFHKFGGILHEVWTGESLRTDGSNRMRPGSTAKLWGAEIRGDVVFVGDGSGVPYGEIYVNDNSTVTSVSSAGFTQFLHFDTNGHSNLSTPDHTNDHITVVKAGLYTVDCCVNIKNSSGAAHVVEVVIAKNNGVTIFANMRRHRTLGTGTDVGAIPICGHLDLAVDDTIEVWITSDSASARNIIGEDVVLMLTMVGGT